MDKQRSSFNIVDINDYKEDEKIINVLYKSENYIVQNISESDHTKNMRVVEYFYTEIVPYLFTLDSNESNPTFIKDLASLYKNYYSAHNNKEYSTRVTYASLFRVEDFALPINNIHIDLNEHSIFNQYDELIEDKKNNIYYFSYK
jgi:hypothetical protein